MGRFRLGFMFVPLLVGCAGGSGQAVEGPATGAAIEADKPAEPELVGVKKKLQGTWEIVRYTSDHPIPNEAMPLMADLFESLRIGFDKDAQSVRTSKTPDESAPYQVDGESGDAFTLRASGGMFDGAKCRFLGADEWEVTDRGKTWPGVSVLRRAAR
ncbi:hypothetical protein [Polyangium sorediatum]|uniref:Lipocalin-like domain-containing protein n=2 Tax=Polyangium TaxID=55 RepID=A0ABT6NV56_9BACT|nr:hypothetical protein [Polyangium sorediatum]MDI1432189.1 hypothetical protein [Polyangium sorediatum]